MFSHTKTTISPLLLLLALMAFVLLASTPLSIHAACLNCGTSRSSSSDDEEKQESTLTSRPDDGDDLFIPILFGVDLDDLAPNFADPRDGGARSHEGLDMLAPNGTPIVTPADVKVLRKGTGPSAGKYVTTTGTNGNTFIYMHLNEIADIRVGDRLRAGDLIGFVGDTGNAKGGSAHLHFEVRDGRTARDPYYHITKELSLEDKMEMLSDILDDYDGATDLAKFLVQTFEPTFIYAQTLGLDLPRRIEKYLDDAVDIASASARDMEVGDKGQDVSVLQVMLIEAGHLNISSPTGYFGPQTKAALVSYQKEQGISPATGYFGSVTKVALRGGETMVVSKTTKVVSSGDTELADLVRLFIALGIIPQEKEAVALEAIATMEA